LCPSRVQFQISIAPKKSGSYNLTSQRLHNRNTEHKMSNKQAGQNLCLLSLGWYPIHKFRGNG
jgi:hypothetical protein